LDRRGRQKIDEFSEIKWWQKLEKDSGELVRKD
jgi:hypothetical protein